MFFPFTSTDAPGLFAGSSANSPRRFNQGLLALLLLATVSFGVRAQSSAANAVRVEQASTGRFSDSNAAPVTDPATILRNARLIYIRKKSVYFKASELENELRKRPEFTSWGLLITRGEADADLIIEVGRKIFTSKFIYTVIDTRTDIVVLSGKVDSIGGTLAAKLAKKFVEQMREVRP